jgi:bacterioferritin-associated ferredoxin
VTPSDLTNKANYLEAPNLGFFPGGGAYSGAVGFSPSSASTDIVRCIQTGSPPTQVTFANDFGSFQPYGAGVTTDTVAHTVTVAPAAGNSGGCFWFPTTIPLNGKTLRGFFNFTFTNADPIGGPDLGNGFTLSFLRGDVGAPNACGTQTEMGILNVGTLWGSPSYFVETDIHHDNVIQLDTTNIDPAGNHTSIMANGNLTHSTTAGGNGYTTSACNGTAQGCLYSPANTFEESPTPLTHNQRIEIHTGCDSTCGTCSSGGPNAQIKVWTDCASCSDTASDFVASTPKASRCIALDPAMGSIYFGFTGGFSSAGGGQGVTIRNLDLRTQ